MKNASLFWKIIKWFFIILMFGAGLLHFINPEPYLKFIPYFLTLPLLLVYLSGFFEILLGLALLFNKNIAAKSAFGIFILMLIFLPLHIWDLFKEDPAIGSRIMAIIRFPIQLLLIYLSYKLYKKLRKY